ncbi:MAG: SIR2 family protein [Acidithiobacillus ferrooxidans]|nr:SIR2 family protein [Acidithiobacillus ferrooxidans]MDD5003308.1 SIR2 family protein [Acidithiobacillus sp.]MDD5379377.1 SIR2 family protein [Acidithiobacillus sp.]MDD5575713.1 SIR2 family protein [Acidithiobacillus sp.]
MKHLKPIFADALAQEQNLFVDKGRVHIRNKYWAPDEILEGLLDPDAYNNLFLDWVQEREEELIESAKTILDEFGLQDRFGKLKEVYARGAVVPFVGAGLSVSSGYPGWTAFLKQHIRETAIDPDEFAQILRAGQYEEAAQRLSDALGPAFNEAVENAFGRSRDISGCVQLLPHVFDSCVITTNFDDVTKRCYEAAGKPFSEELSGEHSRELPRKLAEGKKILLKLHGTSTSPRGRILTATEYQKHYGDGEELQRAIEAICSKTLLFVGCSLTVDRTLTAMKAFVQANGHDNIARHYAFLPVPGSDAEKNARRDALIECNVYPIWYPAGAHDESIEALLLALMGE